MSIPPEVLQALAGSGVTGVGPDFKRPADSAGPKYVKLHPGDDGDGLEDWFFEDPRIFVPPKNQFGEVRAWGVFPYHSSGGTDWDMTRNLARTMQHQWDYDGQPPHSLETPQRQFVKVLIEKKERQLAKLDLGDLPKRDYILRVHLTNIPVGGIETIDNTPVPGSLGEELIYRRFKVSGGINLDAFQDKVLSPVMGWARNAHAYMFEDVRDGSCFGPTDCLSVDMSHMDKTCYCFIDAKKYSLAHLAQSEGQVITYLYDLGDSWCHRITVENILPETISDGKVVVMEGRGMCPPEDTQGNLYWGERIWKLRRGTVRQQNEVLSAVMSAKNYKGLVRSRGDLDPAKFSVAETQKAVLDALASAASVRQGPKQNTTVLHPEALFNDALLGAKPKRGQKVVRDFEDETGLAFTSETVSSRRDKSNIALCAGCGSPHGLKACSSCRKMWYCGPQCQRQDWKSHKAPCKASRSS